MGEKRLPQTKKLSVVALLCLIIGVAGICLSTENYISHNVNVLGYLIHLLRMSHPIQLTSTFSLAPTSPITVISNNGGFLCYFQPLRW